MKMNDLKLIVDQELQKSEGIVMNYPWNEPRAYGIWCAQTYHIVNYSTRLLALSAACAPIEHRAFHSRMIEHAREERGHEKLAIQDLKTVGYESVDQFPQLYQALAMYQIQFFWIQHRHAVSIYGYTLALETLAETFGEAVVKKIIEGHGPGAVKFLKLHAEEDVGHTKSTFDEIESFTDSERALIGENLKISAELYRAMLQEGQARMSQVPYPKKSKAA